MASMANYVWLSASTLSEDAGRLPDGQLEDIARAHRQGGACEVLADEPDDAVTGLDIQAAAGVPPDLAFEVVTVP